MDETYYLGAYWGARRETAKQCAARAEVLFSSVSNVDPSFACWFQQGSSPKAALKHPIQTTAGTLEKLLEQGRDRAVEELGFRLSGWNGEHDDFDASAFDTTCGGSSQRVRNFWLFDLPTRGPSAKRVLTGPVLANVLKATALAWAPDWGVAMSYAHRDLMEPRRAQKTPHVGWVTYLAHHRGTVPPLPSPVRVEPVQDLGTLIILTPDRFTVTSPEHVALAEQVRDRLAAAGLLEPTSP
ncbi:MAG: hypothetical protein EOO72_09605 [Myxococcaceae bacterium]|nr:MAG: hypothetical protein EOO72_09605 [Myxococcaceae bacterium]